MNYFISFQGLDQKPVMYVANDSNLAQTIQFVLSQAGNSPVIVSEAKSI